MNNGELTAEVARALTAKFRARADILFDHGDQKSDGADKVGVIRAWHGDTLNRGALLADLDIAVLLPHSDRAILLIEVEESAASPKVLIGDAGAALIAEHFTFRGNRDLEVGDWTTFVVIARSKTHANLIPFLSKKLGAFKSAGIGKVVIETYQDKTELEMKLTRQIGLALSTPNPKSAI